MKYTKSRGEKRNTILEIYIALYDAGKNEKEKITTCFLYFVRYVGRLQRERLFFSFFFSFVTSRGKRTAAECRDSVRLSINRACSYGIPVTEIDKTLSISRAMPGRILYIHIYAREEASQARFVRAFFSRKREPERSIRVWVGVIGG